jgi:hypothetical protein
MNRINRLKLTAHLFLALHPQFSFRVEHKSPTPRSSSGNRLLMGGIRPGTSLCDQVVSGRPRQESIVMPASSLIRPENH